jgi:hypothetical protein
MFAVRWHIAAATHTLQNDVIVFSSGVLYEKPLLQPSLLIAMESIE